MIGHEARAFWWQLTRLGLLGLSHRIQRVWRIAGKYAYAIWWCTALVLLSALAWPLVVILPRRNWRHAVAGTLARLFFWSVGIPITVQAETAIPTGKILLVSNHSSYLDSPVIVATVPGRLSFVAKEELARQLVAGPFLKRLGTLFVRRTDIGGGLEDTAKTLEAAKAGERIVSFPEGTLTRMPGLLGFHMSVFLVAAQTGLPIIPITIRGTRSILRGGQWFPQHGSISVHVGVPVTPEGTDFEAAVRLRDTVRKMMLAQCHEPDLAHEEVRLVPEELPNP